MNRIQLRVTSKNSDQVVLNDIQYLKRNFDEILLNSHQNLFGNLIRETEYLIEQTKDELKTYYEKYLLFNQINERWFDIHKHYKDTPSAVEFIKCIDHITNYSIAYSYLLLSLSLINGERASGKESDFEEIVSGFLYLSQTTDVFIDFFSDSELHQIYDGAKNAIFLSSRNVNEYFLAGVESSRLVTQLRGYSSLIILSIDEHYRKAESVAVTGDGSNKYLEDDSIETIRQGIYQGWKEARTGEIHPISELWEGIDVD
jgi:hypothetical protein